MVHSDRFVFLDSVQYTKNSFINRNRIKTPNGEAWLTVPVVTSGKFGQSIAATDIDMKHDWTRKHLQTLRSNYGRAAHFADVFSRLEALYARLRPGITIAEFNRWLIDEVCDYLGLHPQVSRSGSLAVDGAATDLLISICRAVNADVYLAGKGSANYQEDEKFAANGIRVEKSQFVPQPYPQLWGEFLPSLSILDALFNCGRQTRELLQ
jgi:hypothetical protein